MSDELDRHEYGLHEAQLVQPANESSIQTKDMQSEFPLKSTTDSKYYSPI